MPDIQITHAAHGHVLTNTGVWSPDSRWVVYDTRSDAAGERFDGLTIERVNIETGEVQPLYRSQRQAHCGVVTCNPIDGRAVFILGPENPTIDWAYGPAHRQGVIVDPAAPGVVQPLDARDITPPFTPGALRGGSHVHVFDSAGQCLSFTYEDHVLAQLPNDGGGHDVNQRNIGVSVPGRAVKVKPDERNHDGDYFSVLVARTVARPRPGSDEICRAFEEAWVGGGWDGRGPSSVTAADSTTSLHLNHPPDYRRMERGALPPTRPRALAFQGNVVTADGVTISEAFIVELPDDLTTAGDSPLEGTATRAPSPPRGTVQRRLTFTGDRKYPGIQGPRHWLRSSPDGSRIGLLMKDDGGVVQFWTVSPQGGPPVQVTGNGWPIASAFTWSPDGRRVAHVMDNSVCVTEIETGLTHRLTTRTDNATAPRPEACVFSPDGKRIAYVRTVEGRWNQIFVVSAGDSAIPQS